MAVLDCNVEHFFIQWCAEFVEHLDGLQMAVRRSNEHITRSVPHSGGTVEKSYDFRMTSSGSFLCSGCVGRTIAASMIMIVNSWTMETNRTNHLTALKSPVDAAAATQV